MKRLALSSGGKVVLHTTQRVERLSIQLLRRRLRLKAIEVLPADKAAQRPLTAAQESEGQQADRVLTRQRGLSLGAPAPNIQATYFFKLP